MIMDKSKKIIVYAGKGSDNRTLINTLRLFFKGDTTTEIIEAREIGPLDPDAVIAVFLPGGGEANYDVNIGSEGFKHIRDYVNAGGSFVSFCAGSYYASQRIEWRMGMGDMERVKEPSLVFFNGIARGPITAITGINEGINKAQSVNVTYHFPHKSIQLKSLYWGGPLFIPHNDDSSFEALGNFTDLENTPPCIIKSNIGNGMVILSAIHPEASTTQVESFLVSEYHTADERRDIAGRLRPHEENRLHVLKDILYQVIDHHDNRYPKPKHVGQFTP
jgi:glutamine amidotransferase-like uncharacterized protein